MAATAVETIVPAANAPEQIDPEADQERDAVKGDRVRAFNKESGDWEWEPATGKRGRPSPSPDKVMKRVRGGGVLELKNKFQKMAEDLFRAEDRNLL